MKPTNQLKSQELNSKGYYIDSLLNGINEKELLKDICVNIKNCPSGNTKEILEVILESF